MSAIPRPRQLVRLFLAAAALSLVPLVVVAQARPTPILPADSDPLLTAKVRAALAAEPDLAGLNLLVSVTDRVAVVGGPVPDEALPARVEQVLRTVPGLAEVKVSCWVTPADDPLKDLVGKRLHAKAPPPAPAEPFTPPPLGIRNPAPTPVATLPRTDEAKARPTGTVTVQRVVPFAFLLEPVTSTGAAITPLPMPAPTGYPTIPPTTLPVDPAALDPLLAEARAKEPRFAGLVVSVKGGTAVISGRAASDRDAWEFARLVRRAGGVDRVVVDRVDVR